MNEYALKIAKFFSILCRISCSLPQAGWCSLQLRVNFGANIFFEKIWSNRYNNAFYLSSELKPELLKRNLSVEESSPRKGSKKSISSNSCSESGFSLKFEVLVTVAISATFRKMSLKRRPTLSQSYRRHLQEEYSHHHRGMHLSCLDERLIHVAAGINLHYINIYSTLYSVQYVVIV